MLTSNFLWIFERLFPIIDNILPLTVILMEIKWKLNPCCSNTNNIMLTLIIYKNDSRDSMANLWKL